LPCAKLILRACSKVALHGIRIAESGVRLPSGPLSYLKTKQIRVLPTSNPQINNNLKLFFLKYKNKKYKPVNNSNQKNKLSF
jgi:hypothetical protein